MIKLYNGFAIIYSVTLIYDVKAYVLVLLLNFCILCLAKMFLAKNKACILFAEIGSEYSIFSLGIIALQRKEFITWTWVFSGQRTHLKEKRCFEAGATGVSCPAMEGLFQS